MKWLRWFVAGALAVPLCHQVVLALLNMSGWISRQPYSLVPTKPFGVPQVISLSFWGGVWGLVLGLTLIRVRSPRLWWVIAGVFGAIAPTLVAGLVVAPLKGIEVGGDRRLLVTGLLVNAAWGLGTAAMASIGGRSSEPVRHD